MGIRAVFTRLLPGDGTEVVCECRQCGTSVSTDTDECPACGSGEIQRYEIPN